MPSPDTTGGDVRAIRAARVRAARAHADMDQTTLGEALGKSVYTVKRLERGQRDISDAELEIVAQATGVPVSFLLGGFTDEPARDYAPLTVHDAQKFLGDAVAAMAARMDELERAIAAVGGEEFARRVRAELNRPGN